MSPVFAVATLAEVDADLLAFSGYPGVADIVSSVALTFIAFLGFGVVTFTAKDLADPSRQLPRALYLALGIATVIYVAVSLGVFGTLTVQETGARLGVLLLGLASTTTVLVAFVFTTLVDEPATAALLAVILVLSVGLDLGRKRVRDGRVPLEPTPAIDG